MTSEQFFKRLERIDQRWSIDSLGAIRSTPVVGLGWRSCPISVMQYAADTYAAEIAQNIGLSKRTAVRIIHAADWKTTPHKKLRARLLKACGLS